MENLNQKGDFQSPKSEHVTKNDVYSCKRFGVYQTTIVWEGCYPQIMFHVKPLDEQGNEMPICFYFASINCMLRFRGLYRAYHKLQFWQSKSTILNSKSTIMLLLYKKRMKIY